MTKYGVRNFLTRIRAYFEFVYFINLGKIPIRYSVYYYLVINLYNTSHHQYLIQIQHDFPVRLLTTHERSISILKLQFTVIFL